MALFRGIQEYIALDANNITLVFDSSNIVYISGNIFLYPPQGHPILYNSLRGFHKSIPGPIRRVKLYDSKSSFYSLYGPQERFVKAPIHKLFLLLLNLFIFNISFQLKGVENFCFCFYFILMF